MSYSIQGSSREAMPGPSFFSDSTVLQKRQGWEVFNEERYSPGSSVNGAFFSRLGASLLLSSVFETFDLENYTSLDEASTIFRDFGITDPIRQKQCCDRWALLRFTLGLKKPLSVSYKVNDHCLSVVDIPNFSIKRRYDLCEDGLGEDPAWPVRGGGGVKQLLRDQGIDASDAYVRTLTRKVLPELGAQMREALGARSIRFWCDWGDESLDFSFTSNVLGLKKVLGSKKRGFFTETLSTLGLIDSRASPFKRPILTPRGREAFFEIHKALLLQDIVLGRLRRKELLIQGDMHALNLCLMTDIGLLEKIRALQEEKEAVALVKKEMKMGVNYMVLHFILMELNANMDDRLFSKDQEIVEEGDKGAKRWLFPSFVKQEDPFEEAVEVGVEADEFLTGAQGGTADYQREEAFPGEGSLPSVEESIRADRLRNDVLDRVVANIVFDFEKLVLKQSVLMSHRLFPWRSHDLKLNVYHEDGSQRDLHREIEKMATDLGALVYDVAFTPSPDPTQFRKILFFNKKRYTYTQRRSRALEFLIRGAIFSGNIGIRGFLREKESIQEAFKESLEVFKKELALLQENERSRSSRGFLDVEIDRVLKREKTILSK